VGGRQGGDGGHRLGLLRLMPWRLSSSESEIAARVEGVLKVLLLPLDGSGDDGRDESHMPSAPCERR
jgi:hypothetical protein